MINYRWYGRKLIYTITYNAMNERTPKLENTAFIRAANMKTAMKRFEATRRWSQNENVFLCFVVCYY